MSFAFPRFFLGPLIFAPAMIALTSPAQPNKAVILDDGPEKVQPGEGIIKPARLRSILLTIAAAFLTAATLVAPLHSPAQAQPPLARLTTPGPWPGISRIIAYDGRIWFVNSNPFRDFNAADVYSFNPDTGETRYERGLFTQDTGRPVVYRGALYWPFEDPRSNLALGEYAVTDGEHWNLNVFTTGIALHVHAMATCKALLMAGTGGWEGALQMSPTGMDDWREVYQFQSVAENLSRITEIRALGDRCFLGVTAWNEPGPKLLEWRYSDTAPVSGWPDGDRIVSPAVLGTDLYAINQRDSVTEIWRFDGTTSTRIPAPPGENLRALASNGNSLFLLTGNLTGGILWRSKTGENWQKLQEFEGERPIAIYAVDDDIYVGTYAANGQGSLWGPKVPGNKSPGPQAQMLAAEPVTELSFETILASAGALYAAAAPSENYSAYRHGMVSVMLPMALTHNELYGNYLSDFMHDRFPEEPLSLFTDQEYTHKQVVQWLVLNMIAVNGNGRVPLDWLSREWPNLGETKEKYFLPQLAAIRAIRWIGQNDRSTIGTLLFRLARENEPLWVKADVVASLSTLTGQRFGYDVEKWFNWWSETVNEE